MTNYLPLHQVRSSCLEYNDNNPIKLEVCCFPPSFFFFGLAMRSLTNMDHTVGHTQQETASASVKCAAASKPACGFLSLGRLGELSRHTDVFVSCRLVLFMCMPCF